MDALEPFILQTTLFGRVMANHLDNVTFIQGIQASLLQQVLVQGKNVAFPSTSTTAWMFTLATIFLLCLVFGPTSPHQHQHSHKS